MVAQGFIAHGSCHGPQPHAAAAAVSGGCLQCCWVAVQQTGVLLGARAWKGGAGLARAVQYGVQSGPLGVGRGPWGRGKAQGTTINRIKRLQRLSVKKKLP